MGEQMIYFFVRKMVRNLSVVPYRKLRTIFRNQFERKREKDTYNEQSKFFVLKNNRFPEIKSRPILHEKNLSPSFDRHYFYHPSWASRVLAEIKPEKHVDISSILRFVGDLSAFIPVDYYEYNVPEIKLSGLTLGKVDLLKLPFKDESIRSLSCMHVIEHVGLGRYGDEIDVDGDIKAVNELKRVLAKGGSLLFVVPLSDKPRIEFNAHRIYSYQMRMDMFKDLNLREFALIPDNEKQGGLIRNATPEMCIGQNYACGCFHFRKKGCYDNN